MNLISKRVAALLLGGVLVAAGAAFAINGQPAESKAAKAKPIALTVDDRPLARDSRMNASFAPVVKKVSQSVVKVFTTTKAKAMPSQALPFGDDPMLRRFFGEQFDRPERPHGQMQRGIGSGVVVTKDGYILTNNHVVDDADEVKVALQDGREFTAKVVGKDPKSDVAVIKIQAADLPRLEMADSDKIEIGDVVLAIGNPFGIGQTVTMGIVSAKGRSSTLGLEYEDFIQTDAAINPGNSGGALIDTDGRLVGINTAIYSHSGGNQGIGFAIPTNLARDVMESLVNDGKVTRGYLGLMIQDVTPALAKQFKLSDEKGALVGDVAPNGPGEKAGIKGGDVIVEFNGKPVSDSRHLKLEAAGAKPGSSVPVKLLREGATKSLDVVIQERPDADKTASSKDENNSQASDTLQGVAVADLDAQAREELKLPPQMHGAVVTAVEPNSAAAEAGIKPGDVITEINHQPVRSSQDAVRLTTHPKSKATLLRLWSAGASHYLVVDESRG